ncbi:UNKNOWN [Stylonychia lemnae]|uniref:Uncharacterized protein n=1 Tax=Stylonychia lemnae TaxID=5949 RepID=A0A078A019_STYLE|nr:UNKNOWN [Stylonychia lemnae]|eukprot:CDW75222.1 UNKNOWN [Stylonychia lemnae]
MGFAVSQASRSNIQKRPNTLIQALNSSYLQPLQFCLLQKFNSCCLTMMKQIELESIKQGINLTINDHEESAQGNGQSTQTFSVQSQAIYRGRGRRPSGAPKNHIDPQAAQKDYQQLFSNWDDDQMDIFQVNDVKNNRELLAALQPIAQKIGFQIKVTQNLSRQEFIKQMEKRGIGIQVYQN